MPKTATVPSTMIATMRVAHFINVALPESTEAPPARTSAQASPRKWPCAALPPPPVSAHLPDSTLQPALHRRHRGPAGRRPGNLRAPPTFAARQVVWPGLVWSASRDIFRPSCVRALRARGEQPRAGARLPQHIGVRLQKRLRPGASRASALATRKAPERGLSCERTMGFEPTTLGLGSQ